MLLSPALIPVLDRAQQISSFLLLLSRGTVSWQLSSSSGDIIA